MAGTVTTNTKKYYGGLVPEPTPQGGGDGKTKVLVLRDVTVTVDEHPVTKKLLCDPDSVITVEPFIEVVTAEKLAEWLDDNYVILLDDGTQQVQMLKASVSSEGETPVCNSVVFKGLKDSKRASIEYPCQLLTDESTLTNFVEAGATVVQEFNLVTAYPEDTTSGTLIDKLEIEDTIQEPEDQTLLEVLPSDGKVAINEDRLRETINGIDNTLDGIIETIDEMDMDSVPHAYLHSTLAQSAGDSVATGTQINVFAQDALEGDCFEFEQTTTIDDTPFGYVWIEPGTYLINASVTLQWVGDPRGTFIAKVGSVMGENFDFSQEQEIKRNTTKIVTIPNRMKLAVNITYDAGTPVMGFWIQSMQVVKLAGGMSQTTVAHDTSLVGAGTVAEPLGISADGMRETFKYAKDEEYFATKQEIAPLATKSALQAETARATQRENEIEELFTLPTQEAVNAWLNAHPEATTTVEDHSLTGDKLVLGALNFVTPEMFGAVGDGVTDDTAAVQEAVDFGAICVFGNKTYYVSDGIVLPSGSRLLGNGSKLVSDDGFVLTIAGADDYIEDIVVEGFDLSRPNGPQSEFAHGVYISHARNVTIQRCSIHDVPGDGIYIAGGGSDTDKFYNCNVNIRYCKIKNWALATNNRQGIAVIQGCVNIEYCEIWQTYATAWCVDVEPNYSHQNFDVSISRCIIHGGITFAHNASGRGSISECVIEAVQIGTFTALTVGRYSSLVISNCNIVGGVSYDNADAGTSSLTLKNSEVTGILLFSNLHRFIAHDCTLIEPNSTSSMGIRFVKLEADAWVEFTRCEILSDATNMLYVQNSSYNLHVINNTFSKIERTGIQGAIYLGNVNGACIRGNRALNSLVVTISGSNHEIVGNTGPFTYTSFNSAGSNYISGNKTNDTPDYVGVTSNRPALKSTGSVYFDTTLGKTIVWNGSAWVNMDGSAL